MESSKCGKKECSCPGCTEQFTDPADEDWIQCGTCQVWWHKACMSYEGGDLFVICVRSYLFNMLLLSVKMLIICRHYNNEHSYPAQCVRLCNFGEKIHFLMIKILTTEFSENYSVHNELFCPYLNFLNFLVWSIGPIKV
jgi:hypothetical protein